MNKEQIRAYISEATSRSSARRRAGEIYRSGEIRIPGVQKVVQKAIERVKQRGVTQRHGIR